MISYLSVLLAFSLVLQSRAFFFNFDINGINVKRFICQNDFIDTSVRENIDPKPYLSCNDGWLRIQKATVKLADQSKPDQACPLQSQENRDTCDLPQELGNTDILLSLQTM